MHPQAHELSVPQAVGAYPLTEPLFPTSKVILMLALVTVTCDSFLFTLIHLSLGLLYFSLCPYGPSNGIQVLKQISSIDLTAEQCATTLQTPSHAWWSSVYNFFLRRGIFFPSYIEKVGYQEKYKRGKKKRDKGKERLGEMCVYNVQGPAR